MLHSNRRLTSALMGVAALLLAGAASALTVTKVMPATWIPNGNLGTGATLSILELPGGGRQFFFAFFANDDSGNATWVTANTTTVTGINSYNGLDLFTNTGGDFNSSGNVANTVVGSADFLFNSCSSMDVTYTLDGGGSGTINFTSLVPDPACPWTETFGAATCPAFSAGADPDIPGACVLPATLNTSQTLTNDLHWVISLSGFRFGDDLGPEGGTPAVLTIEPGTVVVGDNLPQGSQDAGAFFSVSRGNQIKAVGSAEAPIVFTSKRHLLEGDLTAGQWGGVIIAGRGVPNDCDPASCLDELEIQNYGGTNNDDNSGELRYVRIEYAGTEISALAELNGLSLYTVGNGTVIDHIHVHRNGDDGIEWFGGAGNVKYALVTAVDDDSFDMTQGAQPKLQYGIAHMSEAALKDARGFEWDGQEGNEGATPRTFPQFANVTIFYEAGVGEGPQQALRIRRGALFNITNLLVASGSGDLAPSDCLRIDGPQINIDVNADPNNGTIANSVLACDGNLFDDNEADLLESELFNGGANNTTADPQLTGLAAGGRIGSASNNALIPAAGSPADGIGVIDATLFDDFFDKVDYAGALVPGASPSEDWTNGEWTNVDPDEDL